MVMKSTLLSPSPGTRWAASLFGKQNAERDLHSAVAQADDVTCPTMYAQSVHEFLNNTHSVRMRLRQSSFVPRSFSRFPSPTSLYQSWANVFCQRRGDGFNKSIGVKETDENILRRLDRARNAMQNLSL